MEGGLFEFLKRAKSESNIKIGRPIPIMGTKTLSKNQSAPDIHDVHNIHNVTVNANNDKLQVCVLTFNQGYKGSTFDIYENLIAFKKSLESKMDLKSLDIFALCLQEFGDMNIIKYLTFLLKDNFRIVFYDSRMQGTLGDLYIVVFVNKKYKDEDEEFKLENTTVKCPNLVLFTKGGLSLTVTLKGIPVTICNVHLPSEPSNVAKRTECLNIIDSKTNNQGVKIIAGDMNYRTSERDEIPDADKTKIADKTCETNLSNDQLKKHLQTQEKFKESDIKFCATCRIQEDDKFRRYDSKRDPSWCDRIIYSHTDQYDVKNTVYDSMEISVRSDHRAVFGLFEITPKKLQLGGADSIYHENNNELTKKEYYARYRRYRDQYIELKL